MEIDIDHLKGMLLFTAKDDIRHYLNGVAIQGDKMIASDGHRMTICQLSGDSGLNVIIPNKDVQVALRLVTKGVSTINVTEDRIGRVIYTPIDGKFLDWEKVIPKPIKRMELDFFGFRAKYLADYDKLMALVNNDGFRGVSIRAEDSNSTAIVDIGHDRFFCILMPMRVDRTPTIPVWLVNENQPEQEKQNIA